MATAWDVAYYILLPLAWILEFLVFILGIATAPILFAGRLLFRALSFPLRILAKFEVSSPIPNRHLTHDTRLWATTSV